MAEPGFYTDEHISKAVVAALRTNGVDVLTVPEAGTIAGAHHAGIAYASQNRTIGELVRGLMLIHQVLSTDEMEDHVEHL